MLISLLTDCCMKMLGSPFNCLKPMLVKNAMRFKNTRMIKYICSNFLLTVSIKISGKLMSGISEKPCAISCALNLATNLSE